MRLLTRVIEPLPFTPRHLKKDGDEERLSKIEEFMLDFEKNRPAEIDWPDFSKLVF